MHASCDSLFRPKDMTNVPADGRGGAYFEAAALITTAACLAEGAFVMFVFYFFASLAFAMSASCCALSVTLGCRLAATSALWLVCWPCICRRRFKSYVRGVGGHWLCCMHIVIWHVCKGLANKTIELSSNQYLGHGCKVVCPCSVALVTLFNVTRSATYIRSSV